MTQASDIITTAEERITITMGPEATALFQAMIPDDRPFDALYDMTSLRENGENGRELLISMVEVTTLPRRIINLTLTGEQCDAHLMAFKRSFRERWPVAIRGTGVE